MKSLETHQIIAIEGYGRYVVMATTGAGSDGNSAWLQKVGARGRPIRGGKRPRLNLSDGQLNRLGYTNQKRKLNSRGASAQANTTT